MGFVPFRPRLAPSRHIGAGVRDAAEENSVTVLSDTTLWSVAADHLGPAATDWEIAREWPRWHQANRAVVGPDPGQLRPGTVLHPPAPQ